MWFLPEEYLCRFSGRFLLDASYSALLGSTVDTCSFQFTEVLYEFPFFYVVYSDPAFDSRPALRLFSVCREEKKKIEFLGAALVSTTALV